MKGDAGPPSDAAAGGDEVDGAAAGAAAYRIELPEFEGPLDLLLHLCKTHELDILNIPIAFVAEKYVEYLETMQAMSVEIAAEYLVMAATLAYLKARELVPDPEPLEGQGEDGEEVLDPREELIRRLLEYQKYKDVAVQIGNRPVEGRNVFRRGVRLEPITERGELAEHSVWKLIESFADLLRKAGSKISHDVVLDRVSLGDRINQIVDRLEAGSGSFRFDSMIDLSRSEAEVRHQLVVSLLAILELAKLQVIRVLMDPQSEVFYIARREGASLEAVLRAEITSEAMFEGQPEGESEDPDVPS
jgi:segregation and condensation protein A